MSDYSNIDGIDQAYRYAKEFLRPPPKLSPSEWAEANIKIPVGNAISGKIRFDNAPYQREPLDLFADKTVERITLMWGAQTGKTQILNCALAYFIGHDPQSQIMMQPSQGDLHTWLETKFNPMVDTNESLTERIAKPRSREGVNNQNMKSYFGGFLMFSWAGSPRTMRGRSAPKIFCDEVDGYEYNAEGHPVSLLWQRAATFSDQRKLLVTSTPTIKGSSFVESSFEDGDMRRYYIPCPHCESEITLQWKQIVWDKDDNGTHLPDTAVYVCQECGSPISDTEKRVALRAGRWIAEKPFTGHASYHLSELYSGFRRWRDIVRSFLEKKATGDLQSFVNVSLGETWESDGESLQEDELKSRREPMDKLPAESAVLLAGCDVQDDRIEVTFASMSRGERIHVYDHVVLQGDPSTPHLWNNLESQLFRTFLTEDGREMTVRATCIDTGGHYTQQAYQFCKKHAGRRVFAIKGVGGEGKPMVGRPSKNNIGRVSLFPVGVHTVKDMLFARLRINDHSEGQIYFSDKLDDEYFEQLTSEKVVTRYSKGFQRREYVKRRRRNEALDCLVYLYSSYVIIGVNVNALADKIASKGSEIESKPEKKVAQKQSFVPKAGKGFVNSWR